MTVVVDNVLLNTPTFQPLISTEHRM